MSPDQYKAIREKLGLTQGGLAARLGVTRKTINARETGATRITEEAAMAIKTLPCSPVFLISETPPPEGVRVIFFISKPEHWASGKNINGRIVTPNTPGIPLYWSPLPEIPRALPESSL